VAFYYGDAVRKATLNPRTRRQLTTSSCHATPGASDLNRFSWERNVSYHLPVRGRREFVGRAECFEVL
jgi:hypothetical protein